MSSMGHQIMKIWKAVGAMLRVHHTGAGMWEIESVQTARLPPAHVLPFHCLAIAQKKHARSPNQKVTVHFPTKGKSTEVD